jgi:hypothetical protein
MFAERLLEQGWSQSQVARQVRAHRQAMNRWATELRENWRAGLNKAGRAGRRPRRSAEHLRKIARGLKRGPEALGYAVVACDREGPWSATKKIRGSKKRWQEIKIPAGNAARLDRRKQAERALAPLPQLAFRTGALRHRCISCVSG